MLRFIWIICLLQSAIASPRPNIIFILADDLGWNDVGFHGSDEISTPNIDALAYNGIILNNHYSENLCTPSRAALLTGKYPIHTGTQHNVILEPEPWGLPLEFKLMPQHLKKLGYATHAVGKWHLGYFRRVYTPQYRGFDSHYGFWNGYQDYYNHIVQASFQDLEGFDMRRGLLIDKDSIGNYSTDLFTDEAISLIMNHDTERPLFLYLSHLATHAGNYENPLQAPEEVVHQFEHIKDERRRNYAAMLWKLDESVGRVLEALQTAAMLDNTIIVFVSDNGGATQGLHANTGSNYPLKGEKQTPWEGGLRSVACLWSASMTNRSRVATQLMHITDWLPTLYAAAGGDNKDLGAIDGHDMWSVLSENKPSPRNVILHNIDDITRYAAVRVGPIKYVNGTTILGFLDHWVGEDTKTKDRVYDTSSVLNSTTSRVLADFGQPTLQEVMSVRRDATIQCQPPTKKYPACVPLKQPCAFDIEIDPCEKMNLYRELGKEKIRDLEKIIGEFRRTARKPENKKTDLTADPRRYNNVWTNWGDYKNSIF